MSARRVTRPDYEPVTFQSYRDLTARQAAARMIGHHFQTSVQKLDARYPSFLHDVRQPQDAMAFDVFVRRKFPKVTVSGE